MDRIDATRFVGPDADFAAFQIGIDDEVSILACAIFRCPPDVQRVQQGDRVVRRITNAEACVIADGVFEPPRTAVDLGVLDAYDGHPSCPGERVTELLFGCWAYDEAVLVGATSLHDVASSDFPGGSDLVAATCEGERDSRSCSLSAPYTGIGDCRNGVCLPRCLREPDCDELYRAVGDAGPDAGQSQPAHTCDAEPGTVGVCVPEEPS